MPVAALLKLLLFQIPLRDIQELVDDLALCKQEAALIFIGGQADGRATLGPYRVGNDAAVADAVGQVDIIFRSRLNNLHGEVEAGSRVVTIAIHV